MCDESGSADDAALTAPRLAGGPAEGFQVIERRQPSLLAGGSILITGEVDRLAALIGGFHLSGPAFEPIIEPTVAALTELAPALILPGHCTGWKAQHALERALPDAWVPTSVGSRYQVAAA